MLTAALFIIDKTWNQPRCPSLGEWLNKPQYIQKMEYYSAHKNELLSHEETCRNHTCLYTEKAIYYTIPNT